MAATKEVQLPRHLKQDRHLWARILQCSFRDETVLLAIRNGAGRLIILQGLYTATSRNMKLLFTLYHVIRTLLLHICSGSDACMLPAIRTNTASTFTTNRNNSVHADITVHKEL